MPRPRDIQARHRFVIGRHAGRLVKRSSQEPLASAAPAGQASSPRQEKLVTPAGQRRHSGRASAVICQDKPDAPAQQASPLRQDKHRHYRTARVASPTGQALSLWPGQRRRAGIASTATTARQAPPLQQNKRHLADRARAATSAGSVATPTGQGRCHNKANPPRRQGMSTTSTRQAHYSNRTSPVTPTGSVSPLRHGKPRHSGRTSPPFRQDKHRHASRASAVTPTEQAPSLQQDKPRHSNRTSPVTPAEQACRFGRANVAAPAG